MKRIIVALAMVLGLSLAPAVCGGAIPTPIIDLDFNENSGTVAANHGSAGGELTLTTPTPTWSNNVPATVGGISSVDFGTTVGTYCVESSAIYSELTGLTQFTVTGWVNCCNSTEGSGGNRLVTWINHGGEGVDVVYKSDGSVQVGINQWPDGVPARSSGDKIPTDAAAGADNWRFFAVTYDSTLANEHVKFYFGSSADAAAFDVGIDYARGVVGTDISLLSIGHFNVATRSAAQDRIFRGLIDEVKVFGEALTLEQIQLVQMGNTEFASGPEPADQAEGVLRDVVLSWEPGEFAATHDVYFGTSFDDVDAASRANPMDVLVGQGQAANAYEPVVSLDYGQTYYWRVDEVNAPPSSTIFKGDVWSFTVEPYAYPIADVIATSNIVSQANSDPENAVNSSGLDENDLHSIAADDMWLASPAADEAVWIQFEFDRIYKLHELWVWNYNVQFELALGFGVKDVTIEYSEDGSTWMALGDVEFAQATARADYGHNTTVDMGGVAARYVRLNVNAGWGVMGQYGLSEVRFLYIPTHAREPEPADGATDVSPDAVLSWRNGREAAAHDVYVSTDPAELELVGTADTAPFVPDGIEYGRSYYWRVDEVNEAASTSRWEGDTWSFATQEFAVVDDFESYDDEENLIYDSWLDGWVNETGSTVGYLEAPFAEQTIVHGGRQSMPLFYENAGSGVAEAEYAFDAQDWTANGLKSLSLYFHGEPGNTGQLYVKINGTKVVYDGDSTDVAKAQWQVWNIDLAGVGANLGSVTQLVIGVEGAGATGAIYVDDIRLYPKTPELLAPVDPGVDGLLVEYTFDNGTADSSGNGDDGTLLNDAHVADGVLVLDGTDDLMAIPRLGGPDATFNQCTYSMWIYSTVDPATLQHTGGINSDGWSAGGIHCKISGGRANAGINGLAGGDLQGDAVVQANVWVHLALTVSDSEAAIYLNGNLQDSRGFASPLTMILGNGSVGAWNNNGDIVRELKGQMDNVRVYDRALSEAEVLWLAGQRNPVHQPF